MAYIVYFDYLPQPSTPWRARGYVKKYDRKLKKNVQCNAHRQTYCIFNDCYLCYTLKCTEYPTKEKRVKVDETGIKRLKDDPRVKIKKIIRSETE